MTEWKIIQTLSLAVEALAVYEHFITVNFSTNWTATYNTSTVGLDEDLRNINNIKYSRHDIKINIYFTIYYKIKSRPVDTQMNKLLV